MECDGDADPGDYGERFAAEDERQRIAQPERHSGLLQDALQRPRRPAWREPDALAAGAGADADTAIGEALRAVRALLPEPVANSSVP